MKRIAAILTIVLIIIVILSIPASAQYDDCNYPLIPGKENLYSGISAGTVAVTSSDEDPNILFVDFVTVDGWVMTETHLYVGNEPPETSAPGQFTYKHDPVGDPIHDQYMIRLTGDIIDPSGNIHFAAHAAVQLLSPDGEILGEETAWAQGIPIRDTATKAKNWAMYFTCTAGDGDANGGEEQN